MNSQGSGHSDQAPDLAHLTELWLRDDERPRLIITCELELVWVNDTGERLLRKRHQLEVRDRQIAIPCSTIRTRFIDFLSSCLARPSILLLSDRKVGDDLLIRGRRLLETPTETFLGLTVFESSHDTLLADANIGAALGLTPGETRVLQGMLTGRTADDLARHLQISIDTVRSHIRRIYEKLNVSSREGLFSRVRSFGI